MNGIWQFTQCFPNTWLPLLNVNTLMAYLMSLNPGFQTTLSSLLVSDTSNQIDALLSPRTWNQAQSLPACWVETGGSLWGQLVYRMSSRTSTATQKNTVLKNKKQNEQAKRTKEKAKCIRKANGVHSLVTLPRNPVITYFDIWNKNVGLFLINKAVFLNISI